jgi:hypothetical protein
MAARTGAAKATRSKAGKMAIMRWHTKCTTQVQNALTAFNVRRDIESMQRIVEAFEKAHTDAELKIALHFSMQFNPNDDDESPARPRH